MKSREFKRVKKANTRQQRRGRKFIMSASREKQNRKTAGKPPKTAREAQMRKEERRSRFMYGSIGVALLVAIIASILWNSNVIARSAAAATVDGQDYNAAQVSFYYRNAYMTFANRWGGLLSYFGLDTSSPLESQELNDTAAGFLNAEAGTTWKEYFMGQSLDQIAMIQNALKQAKEENFTWPDSVQEDFDEAMQELSDAARGRGVTNGRYLQSVFGAVMTERVYRTELLRLLQSQAYVSAYQDRLDYTEDELTAAYDESPNDYDLVNYESAQFDGTFQEPEEPEEDAEAVENADEDEIVTDEAEENDGAEAVTDEENAADESSDNDAENKETAEDENADESNGADGAENNDADENNENAGNEEADEETEISGVVEAQRSNSGANQSDEETAAVPADEDEENADDANAKEDADTDEAAENNDADTDENDAKSNDNDDTDANTDENDAEEAEEDAEPVNNPYRDKAQEKADALLARLRRHNGNDLEKMSEEAGDAVYNAEEEASYETVGYTSALLADWLFDEDREEGDMDIVEDGDIFYVVVFHERFRDEDKTVKIRHILITPEEVEEEETADDEELTEEEQAERDAAHEAAEEAADEAAQEKAEEIYQEWKDGDATEESFAALAKEYTDDSNGEQGGLYERVYEGQMVTEFNDWCFDPDRKPGDTDIVKTSYGYHIIYFISDDMPRWEAQVFDNLKSEDYNNWTESLTADAVITRHNFGMRFV